MEHSHSGTGSGAEAGCKVSMLWNWYTIDACFISEQWHIRSIGGYVGSLFAIFFLVILVEAFRRLSREYDRKLIRDWEKQMKMGVVQIGDVKSILTSRNSAPIFKPTINQQLIRSLFYAGQFGSGYMLMLLAMYYNGGVILTIFVAAFFGHFLTSWDTAGTVTQEEEGGQCYC